MIPEWNHSGLIPAIHPEDSGTGRNRSPYHVDLWDVVHKFCFSLDRCRILLGFLNYRTELHKVGLTEGFQWLDGSFMENIELRDYRSPNDIDVVTYFALPSTYTQGDIYNANPNLFDHKFVKNAFKVDGYYIELCNTVSPAFVRNISYWYSIWSHTREEQWKGFIEVDLFSEKEDEIILFLKKKVEEGEIDD